MNIDQLAEKILQATVIINNEAPDFPFAEFSNKVGYVLELNDEPLVLNTKRRRQLKNHLIGELSRITLPPSFFNSLDTLSNRRIGGTKRRKSKRTKRKLK